MSDDNLDRRDWKPEDPAIQALFAKRLRGRYPDQTAHLSVEKLREIVAVGLACCVLLQIHDETDVLRLLALSVLVPPEQKKSKLIEGVIKRILAHTDWSGKKRLDFLYKHVVGRPLSSDEIDFGAAFAEPSLPGLVI